MLKNAAMTLPGRTVEPQTASARVHDQKAPEIPARKI